MSHAWRALRHRNFKLFLFGQGISVIGNWMTRLATTWLVYHLTHSALLLGIVSFAGQIVSFALGPFAGVWVERLDRRKLLVWIQAALPCSLSPWLRLRLRMRLPCARSSLSLLCRA
jgi:MFS family permease